MTFLEALRRCLNFSQSTLMSAFVVCHVEVSIKDHFLLKGVIRQLELPLLSVIIHGQLVHVKALRNMPHHSWQLVSLA